MSDAITQFFGEPRAGAACLSWAHPDGLPLGSGRSARPWL